MRVRRLAVLTEYQVHYNMARPHQGITQRVPDDEPDAPRATVLNVGRQQIRRKPSPQPCLYATALVAISIGAGPAGRSGGVRGGSGAGRDRVPVMRNRPGGGRGELGQAAAVDLAGGA